MTLVQQQLTDYRRARDAHDAAAEVPVSHDQPALEPHVLRSGVARITAAGGEGLYTITEQLWDSSANGGEGAWVDAVGGYADRSARDFRNRVGGTVDSCVRFWEQYSLPDTGGGELEVLIDVGDTGGFWARIDGCAAADSPPKNRWKYAWSEVAKSSAGYDGWTAPGGGRSGTTTANPAYNTIEDMNTGASGHTEGNGVDPDHLDTDDYTFTMQPCTTGNIVRMREVQFAVEDEEQVEYWFSYANGVDGECD